VLPDVSVENSPEAAGGWVIDWLNLEKALDLVKANLNCNLGSPRENLR